MGWSLKGIIGGALVGGAGAAERHFVAEDNMARELAAKKEMADYTAEIDFNKTKRLEEWKASNKDAGEMRERESVAENTALASDAAIAAGEKPGTVGYHASMADFLERSGRPEMAKNALAEANRIRTDDTKDQIAAARLDAANARAARGGGGGGSGNGADGASIDIDERLKTIGSKFIVADGDKIEADKSGVAIATDLYTRALNRPDVQAIEDPSKRAKVALTLVDRQTAEATVAARGNKTDTFTEITRMQNSAIQSTKERKASSAAPFAEDAPSKPGQQDRSFENDLLGQLGTGQSNKTNQGIIPRSVNNSSGLPYVPAESVNLNFVTPGKNPRQSK